MICNYKTKGNGWEKQGIWSDLNYLNVKASSSEFLFACLNYLLGSVEKKQQRRSIRTRSESEKSTEVVPKKKIKKEQVGFLPVES